MENLGLGPLAPRAISPTELIAEILADLPEAETNAAALARAHEATLGGALEQPWFEAGETVERLLGPIRSRRGRVKTLLTAYLPQRRPFWTRVLALTGFTLDLDRKTYGGLGRSLALVGREIAGGAPLESDSAHAADRRVTVEAYESRG